MSMNPQTDTGSPMEEQTLPRYRQKKYLPIQVGEVLNARYRIIAKLGYGAYSTVWLARDQRTDEYMSIKVCVHDESPSSPVTNEINMLRRLGEQAKLLDHAGLSHIRLASDIFTIRGSAGEHHCIAAKAHGNNVRLFQDLYQDGKLPKALVKSLIWNLLYAVNWLHAECRVVHTDILPQNILTEMSDDTMFKAFDEAETQNPPSPIQSGGDLIYETKNPMREISGVPVLSDFGQMRNAEPPNTDWCMSDLYRAPEVLLGLPWSIPVDLWSVGVMTLELLEGKQVFDPIDHEHNQYVLPIALGQYVALLGPPPLEIVKQSPLFSTYFDAQGNLNPDIPVPDTSLEDFVTTIPPGPEKDQFLKFMRGILTWDQEPRLTSNEAIHDDWLSTPVEDDGVYEQSEGIEFS